VYQWAKLIGLTRVKCVHTHQTTRLPLQCKPTTVSEVIQLGNDCVIVHPFLEAIFWKDHLNFSPTKGVESQVFFKNCETLNFILLNSGGDWCHGKWLPTSWNFFMGWMTWALSLRCTWQLSLDRLLEHLTYLIIAETMILTGFGGRNCCRKENRRTTRPRDLLVKNIILKTNTTCLDDRMWTKHSH